jgi:hypothetical protein
MGTKSPNGIVTTHSGDTAKVIDMAIFYILFYKLKGEHGQL